MHKQVSAVVQEKRHRQTGRRTTFPRSTGSSGATVARVCGVSAANQVLVRIDQDALPLIAQTTIPIGKKDVGTDVVVFFMASDPARPIIMGRLLSGPAATERNIVEMKIDGQRICIEADEEIVLSSGKASITLTRAGKVVIRGEYILSRSTGVNQIKGGSIQLN